MMTRLPCSRSNLALSILLTFAGTAHAADISIASEMDMHRTDFAKPEISVTEALIGQNGGANLATIDQSVYSGGKGNYAEVNQSGQINQVDVVQSGGSNRARIDQTGSFNSVNTSQNGSANSIDLAQTGDSNLFQASQIGDSNSIVASQMGQSSTSLIENGNNNSITAKLNSPGLNVNISIVGDGMTITY